MGFKLIPCKFKQKKTYQRIFIDLFYTKMKLLHLSSLFVLSFVKKLQIKQQ